jgi:ATP-dependent phosphoenolpyruvate carboxykinase
VRLLNLKESAFKQYQLEVKGNANITFDQAQKKITRNVLLAVERTSLKNLLTFKQVYIYGNMKITVRFGTIIEIENHISDPVPNWTKDEKRYEEISRELGIYRNNFKQNKKRKYIY